MVCKVGGQYEHVPVIPAYCFRVDGDCPYYFRIALTLSTYLKHLRIVCRQAVTVRRTHQFAGNRFYFCVVTLVVWALVQIEPDEEHIGKSLAESAVFGFCWGGQVASCKDQVFFYELYHFLFGKACQRLFHCGIFQYFQRSYDQWTEHVVQGIGNESAGTSYFRSVALFLLRAQEVACFNLCQYGGAAADVIEPTVAVCICICVVEAGKVGGGWEKIKVGYVFQETGFAG